MYHRLSAGSTIAAKTAWTLSEISRKCTNAAIAMCMSWPQAYAPSTICFVPCFLGAELATVPSKVLQEWAAAGFPMPDQDFVYKGVDGKGKDLKPIPYKDLDLNLPWESFDLAHELTTKGIQKFVADYQSTLKRSA